jgi:hypothetical protein
MLKPLEQFICDRCGGVIEKTEDGWIEWIEDPAPRSAHDFKIVHHKTKSPIKTKDGCYHHSDAHARCDEHLDKFLGKDIVFNLIFWIDNGPHIVSDYPGPIAKDLREWSELAKRLLLPYYEEARFHLDAAIYDGVADDPGNPHALYSVTSLKRIAEKYSDYN